MLVAIILLLLKPSAIKLHTPKAHHIQSAKVAILRCTVDIGKARQSLLTMCIRLIRIAWPVSHMENANAFFACPITRLAIIIHEKPKRKFIGSYHAGLKCIH